MRKNFLILILFILNCKIVHLYSQEAKPSKKTTVKTEKEQPAQGKQLHPPKLNVQTMPAKNLQIAPILTKTDTIDKKNTTGQGENLQQLINQSKPVIQNVQNGHINWTEQYIEAKGKSIIDTSRFKNKAQAFAMAERGAVVAAQRNLLEIIQGVNITSETTVKDLIVQNDYIYTRIDGVVKGAKQVGEAIEKDGMVEVVLRVPIYSDNGIAPAVRSAIPQTARYKTFTPEPALQQAPLSEAETPEAVALNLNGNDYNPSIFPIFVDDKGNLLLDTKQLYDINKGDFPKIIKTSKKVIDELGLSDKVKFIDAVSFETGKITIPSKEAGSFWAKFGNTANKIGKFLMMLL